MSAYTQVCSMAKDIQMLKQDVITMKEDSERCKVS